MRNKNTPRWQMSDLPFSILVLFILLFFTYGIMFKAPYSGFSFNNNNAQVVEIQTIPDQGPSLQVGDVLIKIGPVLWTDYKNNARAAFFENNKAGDIVDIIVRRNGIEMTIPWRFTGFTQAGFKGRFFNIWILAYIFWFFGSLAQLLIRPKDRRWWLFIAANYLTACWLIFGSLSGWHIWESSILLHAFTWLMLPVYLHLHWVFPHPLNELPKTAWILFHAAGVLFALAEAAQLLPRNYYALAFLITLLGSIALEVLHFIKQKDQRSDIRLLAISTFIAFVPSIALGFFIAAGKSPDAGPAAFLALPFMPLAYFYIIYRRQLGGLEMRVNRFISLYAFLILFGTVISMLVIPVTRLAVKPETWIFFGITAILFTALIAITGFPIFQAFVEKRLFGVKLPYQNLQEAYSNRITASASIAGLLQLLDDEVFPSLLVRQFAFIQVLNGNLKVLLAKNVPAEILPAEDRISQMFERSGTSIASFSTADEWVRLILPLKAGDTFIGFWLLGRRDPDDHYPQAELPILQSLANQTAIALSNILQTERLQKLYEDDISRNEKNRHKLALDLHDSVLNQLAVLRLSVDDAHVSKNFQDAYDEVTRRLREIVTDLRPPMLGYGLKLAIEALADNLMERSKDTVNIATNLQSDDEVRYKENIEQHIFRIVQEACENAMRHGHAANINISGSLDPHQIILKINDDGAGFENSGHLELDSLLANNHFGLAGIVERIHLIGGEIGIHSAPQAGATIHVTWNYDPEQS